MVLGKFPFTDSIYYKQNPLRRLRSREIISYLCSPSSMNGTELVTFFMSFPRHWPRQSCANFTMPSHYKYDAGSDLQRDGTQGHATAYHDDGPDGAEIASQLGPRSVQQGTRRTHLLSGQGRTAPVGIRQATTILAHLISINLRIRDVSFTIRRHHRGSWRESDS